MIMIGFQKFYLRISQNNKDLISITVILYSSIKILIDKGEHES